MSRGKREMILARYARRATTFDPQALGAALESECSFLDFAFVMGSARDGRVPAGGDIDLAVYFHACSLIDWDRISAIMSVVEGRYPHTEVDVGILNTAGVIYRFESLRGRLLFVRAAALDAYAAFYALACREYEDTLAMFARMRGVRAHEASGGSRPSPRGGGTGAG